MTGLLTDKTAVVTGGSSGNGRAIATAFAEHGADVVVADLQLEPRLDGPPTHEKIEGETGSRATYVECDVTERADLAAAVDASTEFGGCDVMVNNAGIIEYNDFIETTEAEYDRVMDVNTKGVFFGSQIAAEHMLDHDIEGSIINIASIDGLIGTDMVSYCGSKASVVTMTYSMAYSLGGTGIRANAILPGLIETAMTITSPSEFRDSDLENRIDGIPSDRVGNPEDVANVATFLASDLSDYVNAESIIVDGGVANTR